jgi:hypothetical protein
MPGFQGGDRPPRTGPFGQLTIERRVVIVPGSTIPIAGIADVSTGPVGFIRRSPLLAAVVLLAVGAVLAIAGASQNGLLMLLAGGASLACGAVLAAVLGRAELDCLTITSAGGHAFLFTGKRKTLEEARRLLTDKINSQDDSAVYRINFEKGIVHAAGHVEPLGVVPLGPGPAPSQPLPAPAPPRIGGLDLPMPAAGAPVPVLANGAYASPTVHIDYAPVLPQIVDMQRFYAQRPDTQEIADRLNEMEFLMRSGTPTPAGRARLGHLAGELASILGAYPHVVHIFQQAARLAGL